MVTAVVNGRQEVVAVKIDREVVNPDDVEMLEDLVTAAINDGMRKARELQNEEISKVTGSLGLPPGLGF